MAATNATSVVRNTEVAATKKTGATTRYLYTIALHRHCIEQHCIGVVSNRISEVY